MNPEDIPHPYTDITTDFNFKPRKVKCVYCKYEIVTAIPNPICAICNNPLRTIVQGLTKTMEEK